MVLKWIQMNHSDGLYESELVKHFDKEDIKRGLIKAFLQELERENRIEMIPKGQMKFYREVTK